MSSNETIEDLRNKLIMLETKVTDRRSVESSLGSSRERELLDTVASLESQLVSLYEERHSEGDGGLLQQTIASMEEQLIVLYDEKSNAQGTPGHLEETVHNLEEQVVCMTDECLDLGQKISKLKVQRDTVRRSATNLAAAITVAAQFGNETFGHGEADKDD